MAANRVKSRGERANNVLYNVFPQHIAEALIAGRKVIFIWLLLTRFAPFAGLGTGGSPRFLDQS